MFSDNLSTSLLKIIEERKLSQQKLANATNLSCRYISGIICKTSSPTIKSLEKICTALDVTPNELLIPKDIVLTLEINKVLFYKNDNKIIPLCPHCNKPLKQEFIGYCNHCSGKLSWKNYTNAKIIYK